MVIKDFEKKQEDYIVKKYCMKTKPLAKENVHCVLQYINPSTTVQEKITI